MLRMVIKLQARWRARQDMRRNRGFVEQRKANLRQVLADHVVRCLPMYPWTCRLDSGLHCAAWCCVCIRVNTGPQTRTSKKYQMKRLLGIAPKLATDTEPPPTMGSRFAGATVRSVKPRRLRAPQDTAHAHFADRCCNPVASTVWSKDAHVRNKPLHFCEWVVHRYLYPWVARVADVLQARSVTRHAGAAWRVHFCPQQEARRGKQGHGQAAPNGSRAHRGRQWACRHHSAGSPTV